MSKIIQIPRKIPRNRNLNNQNGRVQLGLTLRLRLLSFPLQGRNQVADVLSVTCWWHPIYRVIDQKLTRQISWKINPDPNHPLRP